MLNGLFKSKTRVKLIAVFLLNPDVEYYGRQLEKLTGITQKNVWKELKSLEQTGLLLSRQQGNLKLYRANRQFPVYEELRSIFIKTHAIGNQLREDLNESGNVKAAFIYGSVADGTDVQGSDIDLFILGDVDQQTLNRYLAEREQASGRNINYSLLSPSEFSEKKRAREPFLRRILSGHKIMIVGSEDDLR